MHGLAGLAFEFPGNMLPGDEKLLFQTIQRQFLGEVRLNKEEYLVQHQVVAADRSGVEFGMDAGTQCQHHEHLQDAVLERRRAELTALLGEHQQLPGKILQQHIDLAVRPDSHLPEGHHVEAFFKVGVLIRQLRQHLGRQLHPDDLQRAVGSGIFQSAALPGLEDDQVLLLGGQHHLAAPEHTAAPHDQKQVIIRAGKEFPNSALFKKITFGCIIHQNSLRGTVRCDSLLYTTEKYNCHNCIIHQFAIVFNHFLDML